MQSKDVSWASLPPHLPLPAPYSYLDLSEAVPKGHLKRNHCGPLQEFASLASIRAWTHPHDHSFLPSAHASLPSFSAHWKIPDSASNQIQSSFQETKEQECPSCTNFPAMSGGKCSLFCHLRESTGRYPSVSAVYNEGTDSSRKKKRFEFHFQFEKACCAVERDFFFPQRKKCHVVYIKAFVSAQVRPEVTRRLLPTTSAVAPRDTVLCHHACGSKVGTP